HLELLTGLRTEGEVADRQILFLAARRFIEALARDQPTVLVFEDIHWADSGTHDLLEALASRIRDVPLMLLALARPDLLLARLDALPASERTVLLDASVVGKVFWRGALEQLDGDAAGLSEVLDSLEARDLIRRESFSWIEQDEQFTFKHAVIRDVAYATLPRTRRKSLHAGVAAFLEDATASSAATATALAQHWREAGDVARARP